MSFRTNRCPGRLLLLGLSLLTGQAVGASVDETIAPKVEIPSIGLSAAVPEGAIVHSVPPLSDGTRAWATVTDGESPAAWTIRIQPKRPEIGLPVPSQQLDILLDAFAKAGHRFELVTRERVTVGDPALFGENNGVQVVITESISSARDADIQEEIAHIWTIAALPPDEVVVMSARCMADRIPEVLPTVNTFLAGVHLADPAKRKMDLERAFSTGASVLANMTPERLRALVGSRQWYRTHRPGADANEEVGCMLVEILAAPRGAVNPNRNVQDYKTAEKVEGFLVRVTGLFPAAGGQIISRSQANHWMTWDQSEETWSIVATTTDGRRELSEAMTGVRSPGYRSGQPGGGSGPRPTGSITVIDNSGAAATRTPYYWKTPPVYLSQPLRWILGPMLAEDLPDGGNIRWFSVDTAKSGTALPARTDEWVREGDRFILTSKARPEEEPTVTRYDIEGVLTRRIQPDGSITEPIELEKLLAIWNRKNLPTDSLKGPSMRASRGASGPKSGDPDKEKPATSPGRVGR